MPGHKSFEELYKDTEFNNCLLNIDLTEIEGIDSVFYPNDSLKESQKNASNLYGTKESIFLVNGASVGIIASIMTIVGEGDEIIIPRNAHRSIHNALLLNGAKPIYVMPEIDLCRGIAMGISPLVIERAIINNPKVKAVLLAHPNFYGLCSDIECIAKIVKKYNKIFIVDEACGAHFKFHEGLPISGIDAGADIVIHGTHKNLPALTQSGMIHINTDSIDMDKLKKYLMILQSSSPSYILLASLEIALEIIRSKGTDLFNSLFENINHFIEELRKIDGIEYVTNNIVGKFNIANYDYSKVIINFNKLNVSGYQIERILRDKYGIQCELADSNNIILTFTIADSKKIFTNILIAIQETVTMFSTTENKELSKNSWHLPELVFTPKEVWNKKSKQIKVAESIGRISMENISPFPPAVPIIREGERIDKKVLELLKIYQDIETIKVLAE